MHLCINIMQTDIQIKIQSITTWSLVHMYMGLSCYSPLTQKNETVRSNPRIVEVVTISVVIGKIRQ